MENWPPFAKAFNATAVPETNTVPLVPLLAFLPVSTSVLIVSSPVATSEKYLLVDWPFMVSLTFHVIPVNSGFGDEYHGT